MDTASPPSPNANFHLEPTVEKKDSLVLCFFFFLNRKVYGQLGPAFGRPCLFPCWSWLAEWSTKGGQRWSTGSF